MIDERLIEAAGIMAALIVAIVLAACIWARNEQRGR